MLCAHTKTPLTTKLACHWAQDHREHSISVGDGRFSLDAEPGEAAEAILWGAGTEGKEVEMGEGKPKDKS